MPLYEYRCEDCHHHFEILQRLGEGASDLRCPSCGGQQLAKQFSTFASAGNGDSAAMSMPMGGCCQGGPT